MIFEFEIAGLPKMPNQLLGAHWRVRSGHAKKWLAHVTVATIQFKPSQPLNRAKLLLTRVSSVEPDRDGLCGSFKSIIDALVKCGFLANDKPENIGTPTYVWEKGRPGNGYIRIAVIA